MPSSRRLKATGLIALLTVLIILYITNGARSTQTSPFYTRTVQAIKDRQAAEARNEVVAEEQARNERLKQIQKEHDAAVSIAAAEPSAAAPIKEKLSGDAAKAAGVHDAGDRQKPLSEDVKEVGAEAAEKVIPVAGRKTMGEKVVQTKPASAEGHDGVAKVGNVASKASAAVSPGQDDESEEEHKVEEELNDILKKGPIIIFSKTFCPFSKKAKHILLDLYTISPAPYVVELDKHELGPGLQKALLKSTGRRTVPNVLVNGKSIGGGDDIEALHHDGKLEETLKAMGGKRVVSVTPNGPPKDDDSKHEVKFKA